MAKRGNPNPTGSKPDKLMRDALILALNREATTPDGKKTKRLYIVADKLVELACQGDVGAIREINDRVDGKVPQAVAIDPNSGPLLIGWASSPHNATPDPSAR